MTLRFRGGDFVVFDPLSAADQSHVQDTVVDVFREEAFIFLDKSFPFPSV